jgi:hypothetical protein
MQSLTPAGYSLSHDNRLIVYGLRSDKADIWLARVLGNRTSTWIVVLFGLLAVTLGYVLSGHNN